MDINTKNKNTEIDHSILPKIDKNVLAMDALSKLAKQFNENPDIEKLSQNLLYTLSGQFIVNNAFIIIMQPGESTFKQSYYGIGKFKDNTLLQSIEINSEHIDYLMHNNYPQRVDVVELKGKAANFNFKLIESDTHIITPLILNDKFLGLIGLGERVTKKPFTQNEIEVLEAIVNSITPFIANTFLFVEISSLSSWYLEILNSVKQGIFVFDNKFHLKNINDTGFEILKKYKSKIKNIDSLYNVPMEYIFSESVFPGWNIKINKILQNKNKGVLENLKAGSESFDHIFTVSINNIKRQSEAEYDLLVTIDEVTNQKENELRMFELEKFADKGVMASSIAHELNNFLGMILGGTELTSIHISKDNTDKALINLEKIKENIVKMQRFTAGLMDYTKLNTVKSIVNMNNIIEDVISFISVQKRFSSISIKTDLLYKLRDMEFDADQIAQLLLNFLNNAADAIREKGRQKGQIKIKTYQDSDYMYLLVDDNGIGIKEDVKSKLFNHHLTTKIDGHGYGLVTCNKIIENHNATVEVLSEVGEGAKFLIRFPLNID